MKNIYRSLIILSSLSVFLLAGGFIFAQTYPIKIAIYNDAGVGSGDAGRFEACLTDTNKYKYTEVLGADIRAGILNNFDIVLFPGGSGSGQSASLQSVGLDSVRAYVYRGGGYYGTCGGAYLASADYDWSLNIINTKVIDKAHWNRGDGPVVVHFSNEGKDFFGLTQDTITIGYYQGPLQSPKGNDTIQPYISLGTFATEIAKNGAPSGVMVGTDAYAQSCFGLGRVVSCSPHLEMTDGLHYLVPVIVDWVAGHASFTKFASPLESNQWTAGVSHSIQWISGGGSDVMSINLSTDNGATWSQLSSSSVYSFDWVVPNTPSTTCKLRINSNNRSGIDDTVSFIILPPLPAVTSKTSGNWNSPGTWVDGVIPDSLHDVFISTGHIVTVDAEAKCKSISFGDATGKLGLNANLNIYGNFNCFSTSVNPFYSSSNLWTAGAKMIFTGSASEQTITNLGTTSSSPYPIRFNEIIIDKSDGKFTTGLGTNCKLGIGTSLEVMDGTFELMSTDDIEGRDVLGNATTPTIVVDSDAVFNMVGSTSYIRRGNFIGDETEKMGQLTIYGSFYLACGTTSRVSFTNVSVESGGTLYITSSRGGVASSFNPGIVTVKNGGTLYNSTTTNVWYAAAVNTTSLNLQNGGIFVSYSSTTPYPVNFTNNGTVRYASSSFNQTVTDANYSRLELSKSSGFNKNWTLTSDRIIADSLETNASANLVLSSAAPQSLTISVTINLVSGAINNSGSNVSLILGATANLYETAGIITGCIKTTRTLNQNQADSLGGLGVIINAAGGAPGVTTVTRSTGSCISVNGCQGINRIFHIIPANNNALNAAVSFCYNDADLNSIPESNLELFQSTDSASWSFASSTLDQTNNVITVSNLNTLNYLTAGNSAAPLPVELDKFTTANAGRDVILNWVTKTEINTDQFIVERTTSGNNNWITAGTVKASGNKNTPVNYSFKDKKLNTGKYNYRLKMVDNNGKFTYSPVINSEVGVPVQFSLSQNYPNPFNPSTKIDYQLPSDAIVKIEVYSITGQKIGELLNNEQPAGYYTIEFNSTVLHKNLSSGIYLYRISAINKTNSNTFVNIKKMVLLK
jgi:hypothetical protein